MYYFIYALLYLFSLLPFFILYGISNVAYFIIFYVAGYRKKIVIDNLNIAFPEKTMQEKRRIAKQFYKNLIDTFIETIKLLSLPCKDLDKRVIADLSACNALSAKGINIQFHTGHQMNWEYVHLVHAKHMNVPWVGVYMKISNKSIDKLFYKIRNRYNAVMISAHNFTKEIRSIYNNTYSIGLIADQNPPHPSKAYWLYFFSKPAPFVPGPEKGAMKNKTAVVFVNFIKIKRGFYKCEHTIITEDASQLKDGELTILYRNFLEESIRKQPDNYLWSHRRWKWDYNESYNRRWIDDRKAPI